jgi:hypothetical protein
LPRPGAALDRAHLQNPVGLAGSPCGAGSRCALLRSSTLPQHPDEHRPERPVLLAVNQEFGEGRGSPGSSRTRRSYRPARSREHEDVEQLGARGGAESVEALPVAGGRIARDAWLGATPLLAPQPSPPTSVRDATSVRCRKAPTWKSVRSTVASRHIEGRSEGRERWAPGSKHCRRLGRAVLS